MKTTRQNTRSFPKPFRFSLYVCAVVVLCFFNWVALQAEGTSKNADSLENRLTATLVEEPETEIKVQEWMLTFCDDYLAADEPEIEVESWMLTFAEDNLVAIETEIEVESWMLTFSDDNLASANEAHIAVEPWMVNTFLWDCASLLARR